MFSAAAAAREREFGVRLALGSAPRGLAWLVVRQGIAWLGAGLSGGVIGIVVVTKLVSGLLYRTSPADPTALAAAVAVLMACAAVALFIPMRRAMRIDPIVALRTQ
jgi:ABC-type antimicrobial peptide transport system permease subunit